MSRKIESLELNYSGDSDEEKVGVSARILTENSENEDDPNKHADVFRAGSRYLVKEWSYGA